MTLESGIAAIVADAERAAWPPHDLDAPVEPFEQLGLYLGRAGMLWALRRLGSALDVPIDVALLRGNASLLIGETGVLLVTRDDDARLQTLIDANAEHPSWELLWGSPGTLIAARHAELDASRSAEILWARRRSDGLWQQRCVGRDFVLLGAAHGFAG
ncbi:MAG TPA: hypothetical protein VGU02_00325, partial [Gaiellaceae bacterium]|nr:hypothetical protein [Gaiellaceae bacterium]